MFLLNWLLLIIDAYKPLRTGVRWLAFKLCLAGGHSVDRYARGQGLVEYALILVLVAIVVIVVLALLGPAISQVFGDVYCAIQEGPDARPNQHYELQHGRCQIRGDGHT